MKSVFTDYMEEYSKNIDPKLLEEFEPDDIDASYNKHDQVLYERKNSVLPNQMEFSFDPRESVIKFSKE